jgi:hypothetical protein
MRRPRFTFLIFLIITLACCILLFRSGFKFILQKNAENASTSEGVDWESKGIDSRKASLHNVEVIDPRGFPSGSILRIQKFTLHKFSLNFVRSVFEVDNGRLILPSSETILFYGIYNGRKLDFTVYSHAVNIRQAAEFIPHLDLSMPVGGEAADFDVKVRGDLDSPSIAGDLFVENFFYRDFSLFDSPAEVDLVWDAPKEQLRGNLVFHGGTIKIQHTIVKTNNNPQANTGLNQPNTITNTQYRD